MNKETKLKIEEHINKVMDTVINRTTTDKFVNEENINETNPFAYRLIPVELWKDSKFHRLLVTALGIDMRQEIAKIIAEDTGAKVINDYTETMKLNIFQVDRINNISHNIHSRKEHAKTIKEELAIIRNSNIDKNEEIRTLFDLYIERPNGRREYYYLRTLTHDSSRIKKVKRDMLIKMLSDENAEVYLAVEYNSRNTDKVKTDRNLIYDTFFDENILIGREFWNKIGENENTYDELISIFEKVGSVYINKIREEKSELIVNTKPYSVSFEFNIDEYIKGPCKQYLIYFTQFLKDIGIDAKSEMSEEINKILFEVIPNDKNIALKNIKKCLEIYIKLIDSKEIQLYDDYSNVEIIKLKANINHLKSQLMLANATIEQQKISIHQQSISIQLLENSKSSIVDEEEICLLDGMIKLKETDLHGIHFNIPKIFNKIFNKK